MKKEKASAALGRPRAFDASKALDQAMQVFWQKGYLGTSLSDLTAAMGINRPSLYAAYGNKEALFRQALERYVTGPSAFAAKAMEEPTARQAVDRLLRGVVELLTDARRPPICFWVHGALSCGDDPIRQEFRAQRAAAHAVLRDRFLKAIADGELPADADAAALARFVQTVNHGLAVQASTGAARAELLQAVEVTMRSWPWLAKGADAV